MRRSIERLSDHFGQFDLTLICRACGQRREVTPIDLARRLGWETSIAELAAHLRCSKCFSKDGEVSAQLPRRPRGYSSLPK